MRLISRFIPHGIVIAFVAWCAFALRSDLARLSLAPVLRSWDLVALAAALSLANYALRIFRWRFYLRWLGHALPVRFGALTFVTGFAYTLSPGKVGEMARARYYLPLGVPLTSVTAAFFAERLMDLIAMIALAALLFAGSQRYEGAIAAAAALVAGVLAVLRFVPWAALDGSIRSWTRMPAPLRAALGTLASALASTRPLLRPGAVALGLAVGLLAWGLEGVGFGVLGFMVPGTHLDMAGAVGIYAIAVLVGGLSFLPGGLGSTEAVMTTLLVTRGFALSQALLVTLTCRLVTLWLAVGLGWLAVLMLRQRTRRVEASC